MKNSVSLAGALWLGMIFYVLQTRLVRVWSETVLEHEFLPAPKLWVHETFVSFVLMCKLCQSRSCPIKTRVIGILAYFSIHLGTLQRKKAEV